mgnify:CR=1 FL=1
MAGCQRGLNGLPSCAKEGIDRGLHEQTAQYDQSDPSAGIPKQAVYLTVLYVYSDFLIFNL